MIPSALLNILGYKVDSSFHWGLQKQRIGIFPHTSRCEVVLVCLALQKFDLRNRICFAVANQYIENPIIGPFLTFFGGFPVYQNNNTTRKTVEYLRENENKSLAISPEGRLIANEWRSGFYHIAKELKLPVIVCGVDFLHIQFVQLKKNILYLKVKQKNNLFLE